MSAFAPASCSLQRASMESIRRPDMGMTRLLGPAVPPSAAATLPGGASKESRLGLLRTSVEHTLQPSTEEYQNLDNKTSRRVQRHLSNERLLLPRRSLTRISTFNAITKAIKSFLTYGFNIAAILENRRLLLQ